MSSDSHKVGKLSKWYSKAGATLFLRMRVIKNSVFCIGDLVGVLNIQCCIIESVSVLLCSLGFCLFCISKYV